MKDNFGRYPFHEIEQRLLNLEQAVARLESPGRPGAAASAADGPTLGPAAAPQTPAHEPPNESPPPWRIQLANTTQKRQVPSESNSGAFRLSEDFIGRRVLPVTGAILLLAGLGFWTPVAYHRLSPVAAFSIELMFCALFFVVGRLMKDAKYHFGEILAGTGSGGLLVTIGAGSQCHHLYSDQVMIGLGLAASIGIGIFGAMISSKTFQAIGTVGGMISAWAPCCHNGFYVSAALEAVIVGVTLVVFAQGKWRAGIVVLWPIALAACAQFVFQSQLDWRWRVACLDVIGLEFAIAYALSHRNWKFDPQAIFVPLALTVSVVGTWAVHSGSLGSVHGTALSIAIAASGLLFLNRPKIRDLFWLVGAVSLMGLVPFGLEIHRCVALIACFSMVAAAAALLARSSRSRCFGLSWLAIGEVVLGICTYVSFQDRFGSFTTIATGLMLTALVGWVIAVQRASKFGNNAAVVAALLGWALVSAVASNSGVPFGHDAATSGLWALWGLALLSAGYTFELRGARFCGLLLLAVSLFKVVGNDLSNLDGPLRSAILFGLGIVMLAGGYVSIRGKDSPAKAL